MTFNGAPAAYYSSPVHNPKNYAIADSPEYKVADASFGTEIGTLTEIILSAAVTDIDAPVIGAKPDTAATAGASNYSVEQVVWNAGDDKFMEFGDVFEAGKTYTVGVWLKAAEGKAFSDSTSATLNGQTATIGFDSKTPQNLMVYYTFPALKADKDSGTGSGTGSGSEDGSDSDSGTGSSSGSGTTGTGTGSAKPNESYTFPFTDVAEGAWYRKDVETAHKNGLVNGKSDTMYYPDDNMTYAEAVKLACAMHQLYHDKKVTLTAGNSVWYSTYMSYALEKGIIDEDLTAVADEKINRSDFVKIFYAALPNSEYTVINEVADHAIPDVSLSAKSSKEIYAFYRAGILVGSDNEGTFNPESNIIRSEVAAILTRMFDGSARKTITLK